MRYIESNKKEIFERDVNVFVSPYNKIQTEYLLQNNEDWILALQGYAGQIAYHYPRHPIIEFAKKISFVFPLFYSGKPLVDALNIFTDGSSTGKAVVYVKGQKPLIKDMKQTSAQQAEIRVVMLAFKNFQQPFNLFTDSRYVANLFPSIETALLSGSSVILPLLRQLQQLIHQRVHKFCIVHIRGHSNLPGSLARGNAMANLLTRPIIAAVTKAQESHALHHQNALTLKRMFNITKKQTRQIVKLLPLNGMQIQ